MRHPSICEVNRAQNIQPSTGELFYWRCDADQADHVLRHVVDQERRVDIEVEQRSTAEVVPATVVDSPAPAR